MHNALGHRGRREDEQVARQRRAGERGRRSAYPPRAVRFYLAAPHYRSAIEFSDTSLDEATAALDRIDSFVQRGHGAGRAASRPTVVPDAFAAAMDDDLGTPRAVAVLYTAVRDGNDALDAGGPRGVRGRSAEVRGMLDVLGLDLDDPAWQGSTRDDRLQGVVDGLVGRGARAARPGPPQPRLRHRRRAARPAHRGRDRGRGHAAGSRSGRSGTPRPPAGERLMPGNSQRKGAVRRKGKGNTAGSGGRVRRGLEGRGPTPKAEDRPYHAAPQGRRPSDRRPATGGPGAGPSAPAGRAPAPEWVVGRNAVLEAMEAEIPVKSRVRRRGRRARRPAARGVQARRRPQHADARRSPAPSSTG